jgi:hypothetical protein
MKTAATMSNAIARRYFVHANDMNEDGSLCCFFAKLPLDDDSWGFWVEADGTVEADFAPCNGKLPSRKIVEACVRSAVKFLQP